MEENKNILVVDDEEDVRYIVSEILSNLGYNVIAVDNADKINELFTNTVFCLVITDLIMPGKNGAEVISEIKKIAPDIPILAMSGGARLELNDNLQEAMANGANDCIYKPFTINELVSKINSVLS